VMSLRKGLLVRWACFHRVHPLMRCVGALRWHLRNRSLRNANCHGKLGIQTLEEMSSAPMQLDTASRFTPVNISHINKIPPSRDYRYKTAEQLCFFTTVSKACAE
jgi:hypothetical protein